MYSGLLVLLLGLLVQGKERIQRCPKGISRFSASHNPAHYFQCDQYGRAVLTECPQGLFYNAKSQECKSRAGDDPKSFDRKLVELTAGIGHAFNAKTNKFINKYLWGIYPDEDKMLKYDRKEVTTSFDMSVNKEDKMDKLDIAASLKLDFLSGQVGVEGSMQYLDDESETDRAINVNMMYHTTKRTETMPKYVQIVHDDLCTDEEVTHVVTSRTWGLDAFMVFEYLLSEHETTENIYGELKLTVSAIPGLSVEGSGSVNLTESQIEMMTRTNIDVFGIGDQTIITDFDEACAAYQNLPELSADPRKQKVLEVRLTPITDMCTEAEYILHELSSSTNTLALDMLSNLEKLSIKANGLITNRKPTDGEGAFDPMVYNLKRWIKELEDYTREFKNRVKDAVQAIRKGEHGEEELMNILQEHQNSMFEFDRSNEYLINRNREIKSVIYLLDAFPNNGDNIIVVDFENSNDIGMILDHKYSVALELQILTPESVPDNFIHGHPTDESTFWYNHFEENGRIGSLIKNFKNFAWENDGSDDYGFMIKLNVLDENNPQSSNHQVIARTWNTEDRNFIIPTAPEIPEVQNIGENSFDVKVKKLNEYTNEVEICVYKAFGEDEDCRPLKAFTEDEMFTISSLDAVTLYYITVKYKTEFGFGPPSLPSSKFMTGPSSKPANLRMTEAKPDSLRVEWDSPDHMGSVNGDNVLPKDLSYRITVSGKDGYRVTQITNETVADFSELQDASIYDIEAVAFLIGFHPNVASYGYSGYDETTVVPPTIPPEPLDMLSESLPATITTHSNILPPTLLPPLPGQVDKHEITVRWAAPTLSDDTNTASISYTLFYNIVNSDIVSNITGITDTQTQVSPLEMGEEYEFQVMIVANTGISACSDKLVIKTLDDKTDLDIFVEDVEEQLKDLEEQVKLKTAFCASKSQWTTTGTITYDQVFLANNTIDNAEMDKESGKFNAGAKGSYMISASLEMALKPGQEHKIWIQKNDENVEETLISSTTDKYSYLSNDNGSKDIVLALEENDKVSLFHDTQENQEPLNNIIFCVRSVKVDLPTAQHN